jgi:hypothetical protein
LFDNAKSTTQVSRPSDDGRAQFDILLTPKNSDHVLVAIESKIDAELAENQLPKYDKVEEIKRAKKKVCLVKRYYSADEKIRGWDIKYWRDFYLHLSREKPPNDEWVIPNFISILEDYRMKSPLTLQRENLAALAKSLFRLRNDKDSALNFRLDAGAFETMLDLKVVFEDLFRRASNDEIIGDGLRNKRPSMWLSNWYMTEATKKRFLLLSCEASLKKPKNGVKTLRAVFILYGKLGRFDVAALVDEENGEWSEKYAYYWKGKSRMDCEDFSCQAISVWRRALQKRQPVKAR